MFYCVSKYPPHQANKDKPRSAKCRHFCFSFDSHNYCPTCRESCKGDDPCVTFESPCGICAAFSEEQLIKISHRKRYIETQKQDTTKDDELDLLGDEEVESFTRSQAELKSAADNLFTSPPRPQPLPFESSSLKTPAKCVPPTPDTALQQKIESKLEKSLGNTFNIQLQQQMGVFIALIHPIQWTIAYPVGADRPAKRQKKTSCVSTGQAGPVLCTRQMACHTSFLSRQSDVIASFSFGACTCDTVFLRIYIFKFYVRTITFFAFIFVLTISRRLIAHYVFSQSTTG